MFEAQITLRTKQLQGAKIQKKLEARMEKEKYYVILRCQGW